MSHLFFRRVNGGAIGVGYRLEQGSHAVYSVAWPDAEARKYLVDPEEMERMGVELVGDSAKPVDNSALVAALQSEIAAYIAEGDQKAADAAAEIARLKDELAQARASIAPAPVVDPLPPSPPPQPPTTEEEVELETAGQSSAVPERPLRGGSREPNAFVEAQAIRDHLNQVGLEVSNKSVVAALKEAGIVVQSSQVTEVKEQLKKELGS